MTPPEYRRPMWTEASCEPAVAAVPPPTRPGTAGRRATRPAHRWDGAKLGRIDGAAAGGDHGTAADPGTALADPVRWPVNDTPQGFAAAVQAGRAHLRAANPAGLAPGQRTPDEDPCVVVGELRGADRTVSVGLGRDGMVLGALEPLPDDLLDSAAQTLLGSRAQCGAVSWPPLDVLCLVQLIARALEVWEPPPPGPPQPCLGSGGRRPPAPPRQVRGSMHRVPLALARPVPGTD